MKTKLLLIIILFFKLNSALCQPGVLFVDDMNGPNDTISLKARGYKIYNRSTDNSGSSPIWFQGDVTIFNSFNGPSDGYLATNYNCMSGPGDQDIWLVLPSINLKAGDSISFYSQSPLGSVFPDSLRVMYSAIGDSTPEGLSWVELGRFQVNTLGVWEYKSFEIPYPGNYGRIAIRSAVVDGGPLGANSDYVGIDHLVIASGDWNTITGKIFIDQNSNGVQDSGENSVSHQMINESNTTRSNFSLQNGYYYLNMPDSGNYSVSPSPVSYYTAIPALHNIYFNSINQIDSLNDFALQPTGVFNDLCVSITALGNFRTGMGAVYMINYGNYGTTTINPTVTFYPDPHLNFVNSLPSATSAFNDSVVWNFGPIAPFQTGTIWINLTVNIGTPIGTLINSSVLITPIAGDANPLCNDDEFSIAITGSYDPNEIIVDNDTISQSVLVNPPFLDYTIYFQNTGNDTAFTIRVLNTIPVTLNSNTFELVSSSHPVNITYNAPARLMTFQFDNIQLADSNVNEAMSHGFVRYRIKPQTNLIAGDLISNLAYIYFDYNLPVVTNTALTNIVLTTEIINPKNKTKLLYYPNPVKDYLTIKCESLLSEKSTFMIYDLFGKTVFEKEADSKNHSTEINVNVKSYPTGVYTIELNNGKEVIHKKFIKQ